MYVPRHWHWVLPVTLVLLGFYVRTHYGAHWDVFVFVQLPLCAIAVEWGAYIWQAGVVWQKFSCGEPVVEKQKVAVPYNNNGSLTTVHLDQVTEAPKINNERKFYRTLIDMRNHNFDVILTESYWVEEKIGNSNRYGEPRDNFVNMKERGVKIGSLERAGQRKNAPHQVKDWRIVRLIADGTISPAEMLLRV